MRIADATTTELQKELSSVDDGSLDKFKKTTFAQIETYARLRTCQQLLKTFLNSLMLQVLHKSVSNVTRQQDELAYIRFVEDLCRFAFSSPQCYPFLLCVRTALHKSFLTSPRLIEAVLSGVRTCISKLKDSSTADAPESLAHFEFLGFALERLEAKVSGKDASAVLDKTVAASTDKKPHGNKFLEASAAAEAKRRILAEEEEAENKRSENVPKATKTISEGDLKPAMLGKKRIISEKIPQKDLKAAE
jgi:hypothetical protein